MTARSILAFGLNDSRLILRDSFLRMMAAIIVLIALGLRFGLPPLTGYLEGLGLLPGAASATDLRRGANHAADRHALSAGDERGADRPGRARHGRRCHPQPLPPAGPAARSSR